MTDVEVRELKEGIEEGWITPGSGALLRDHRRWSARERVLDVLSEDRGS